MTAIFGIAFVFAMVFGGYILAGGKMAIILKSLPFELMMIGGAAIGSFAISNNGHVIKSTAKDLKKVISGPKWKSQHYRDLLCLLFELIKMSRNNPVKLEEHIENPAKSDLFNKYPDISSDVEAISIICDTLRTTSMNLDDPHQVEIVLEHRIEELEERLSHSSHALQIMADGLPALGIVAAVLGVIKTMSSIDQPPEVLGKLIGGALVGTFLGVFLAYGIVGPFSAKLKSNVTEDMYFYKLIQETLVYSLHRHPPNVCVEVGRQNAPSEIRPSFSEIEAALRDLKKDSA